MYEPEISFYDREYRDSSRASGAREDIAVSKREFIVPLEVDGGFGRVVEGEQGYYPSAAVTQEDADDMN